MEGRAILVTGAAGNLGTAVCRRLLAEGARVAALVSRAEAGEKLRAALGAGERLVPVVGVLGDERSGEAAVAAAEERAGPLWAVVHTVGDWVGGTTVAQATLAQLDAMIEANLKTAFVIARAAMRGFAARKQGRFVAVAAHNVATSRKLAGGAAYAASKAALIALVRALAEEGTPIGVRANCVAPGTMRTPKNAAAMSGADQSKWVALDDVAAAIAFLCSDAAAAINGSVVLLPEG